MYAKTKQEHKENQEEENNDREIIENHFLFNLSSFLYL